MPGFGRGPPGPAAGRGPPAPAPGRGPPGRGPPAAAGRGPPGPAAGRGPPALGPGRGVLLNGLLPGRGAGRGPGRGPPGAAGRPPPGAPPDGPGRGPAGRGPGAAGACGADALAAGACGAGAAGRAAGRGPGAGAAGRAGAGAGAGAESAGRAGAAGAAGRAAAGAGRDAGAAGAAAPLPAPLAPELPSASRSRRATGASTVEEADFTNSPCSLSLASTVLLSTPNSLASSCTRALPGTDLLGCEAGGISPRDLGSVVGSHFWDFTACSSDDVLLSTGGSARAGPPCGPGVFVTAPVPGPCPAPPWTACRGRGPGADRPPSVCCSAAHVGRPGVAPLRAGTPGWGAVMPPGRGASAVDPGRESRSGRRHAAAR